MQPMRQIVTTLVNSIRSTKIVSAFVVVATVAVVSATGVAAAAPNFFNVPKPTSQKVCYAQYGGAGWQALGFKDLDNCLRYVSTPAPTAKENCNHGYWFVYGFNSWNQCANWVVAHGGSGYAGDPSERF
ncbi:MAG TPA: hypothetical protein VLG16_04925 [Candidatus Saccharimonadales bacterium]|nr:hypothetical protein [Candidatus Saccharimonadales bacterium]